MRRSALLALLGIVLQVALNALHSARHFDHLVGPIAGAVGAAERPDLRRDPLAPLPNGQSTPDLDHCAIGAGLAAAVGAVVTDCGVIPLPSAFAVARLTLQTPSFASGSRRHPTPPARAPPLPEMSA